MNLGAQNQTEIMIGAKGTFIRAKMNSALPYIDPPLGGQDPGSVVLPQAPTSAPSLATFLQPTHLPPAGCPKTLHLLPSLACRSVLLAPRPKLSLHPGVQAEL